MMASVGPTPPAAPGCAGSRIGSPRCAAASMWTTCRGAGHVFSPRSPAMAEPPPGGKPLKESAMPEFGDAATPKAGPASAPAIRVVLADDSVLFREGLARVLAD